MKRVIATFASILLACSFLQGQEYKVIWSFIGSSSGDGANPLGDLVLGRDGSLYGTTKSGGATPACNGCGVVFRLTSTTDGTWVESILYSFCSNFSASTCRDGALPVAGLVADAKGNLYGSTTAGGSDQCAIFGGCGTVFELSPPSFPGASWKETVLYAFCAGQSKTCPDGAVPTGRLALDSSGNLFGTTSIGGNGHSVEASNGGTAFELGHGGSGWMETVIYNFCTLGHGEFCPDGSSPEAGLTFDKAGSLYGTTKAGGSSISQGGGTVYKLSPTSNGWTETILKAGSIFGASALLGTVSFDPLGSLYTTFSAGGEHDAGGMFRLTAKGATTGYSFNSADGGTPTAGVLIDARRNALYGTNSGGITGFGDVFKMVAPAQETVLYTFCSQSNCTDGATPVAGLIEDKSGNLYGTTKTGGTSNMGVVFEIVQSLKGQAPPAIWRTILPIKK